MTSNNDCGFCSPIVRLLIVGLCQWNNIWILWFYDLFIAGDDSHISIVFYVIVTASFFTSPFCMLYSFRIGARYQSAVGGDKLHYLPLC